MVIPSPRQQLQLPFLLLAPLLHSRGVAEPLDSDGVVFALCQLLALLGIHKKHKLSCAGTTLVVATGRRVL